jgi:hypothetical protein
MDSVAEATQPVEVTPAALVDTLVALHSEVCTAVQHFTALDSEAQYRAPGDFVIQESARVDLPALPTFIGQSLPGQRFVGTVSGVSAFAVVARVATALIVIGIGTGTTAEDV